MVANRLYVRDDYRESTTPPTLPATLDLLMALPHVQQLDFSAEQIILYEGHVAPGVFVFWDGLLQIESELFQELRTIQLSSEPITVHDTLSPELPHAVHPWWVCPERQQLPLALPFTISTLEPTRALFLPRSLTSQVEACQILHSL